MQRQFVVFPHRLHFALMVGFPMLLTKYMQSPLQFLYRSNRSASMSSIDWGSWVRSLVYFSVRFLFGITQQYSTNIEILVNDGLLGSHATFGTTRICHYCRCWCNHMHWNLMIRLQAWCTETFSCGDQSIEKCWSLVGSSTPTRKGWISVDIRLWGRYGRLSTHQDLKHNNHPCDSVRLYTFACRFIPLIA